MGRLSLTPAQVRLRKKWVAALRSGKYQQGRGQLKYNPDRVARYCCLGVLCAILDPKEKTWNGEEGAPPARYNKMAGLRPPDVDALVAMNDTGVWASEPDPHTGVCYDASLCSFKDIADAIEADTYFRTH